MHRLLPRSQAGPVSMGDAASGKHGLASHARRQPQQSRPCDAALSLAQFPQPFVPTHWASAVGLTLHGCWGRCGK